MTRGIHAVTVGCVVLRVDRDSLVCVRWATRELLVILVSSLFLPSIQKNKCRLKPWILDLKLVHTEPCICVIASIQFQMVEESRSHFPIAFTFKPSLLNALVPDLARWARMQTQALKMNETLININNKDFSAINYVPVICNALLG